MFGPSLQCVISTEIDCNQSLWRGSESKKKLLERERERLEKMKKMMEPDNENICYFSQKFTDSGKSGP